MRFFLKSKQNIVYEDSNCVQKIYFSTSTPTKVLLSRECISLYLFWPLLGSLKGTDCTMQKRCILCWLLVVYSYTHSVAKPKFPAAEKASLIRNEGKLRGLVVGQSSSAEIKQQISLLFSLGMNYRYVLNSIIQLVQCPCIP